MIKYILLAVVAATSLASAAQAVIPMYSSAGTENSNLYTFKASATGSVTAYYAGSTAGYTEDLGLLVNGVDTGTYGLNNKTSSLGDVLHFGSVTAGDTLTFFTRIISSGDTWYSTKSLNSDGANHIWAVAYAGGDAGIPAGTLIAFEDLPKSGADFNYNDEKFVFTNVSGVGGAVPEPATWSMLLAGFGMVGVVARRRKAAVAA